MGENCKYVNFGFFGNLEVISRKAVATYLASIDDCRTSLNYLGKEKDYGNEAWGEDLFAQRCMDLHGVDKVSVFDLTTDGMCEAFRPEGQKKNKKWTPDCATTTTAGMHPFKPHGLLRLPEGHTALSSCGRDPSGSAMEHVKTSLKFVVFVCTSGVLPSSFFCISLSSATKSAS